MWTPKLLQPELHFFAEGSQRENGHLEVLLAPGNADDSDAEQKAEEDVHQPRPKTTADEPDKVEGDADATCETFGISNLRTERPEAEQPDLERLQRHGKTDDGDGHSQTAREITDGGFKPAKNPPNDVAKDFHKKNISI